MNTYRKLLAAAISRNAGYSSRHDKWPLEFNVGLYYADLDRDHIEALAVSDHGVTKEQVEATRDLVEWDPESEWTDIQSQMHDGLNDDDGNRTYSPATAASYGLPYHAFPQRYKRRTNECAYHPTKKDGWIKVSPYTCKYFDVEFALAGRGGKHLVVESFDGVKLCGWTADDLEEALLDDEQCHYHGFTNDWCRNLLTMITTWSESFTPERASSEMEYLAADRYAQQVNEALDSDEFASKQFAARNDLCTA